MSVCVRTCVVWSWMCKIRPISAIPAVNWLIYVDCYLLTCAGYFFAQTQRADVRTSKREYTFRRLIKRLFYCIITKPPQPLLTLIAS